MSRSEPNSCQTTNTKQSYRLPLERPTLRVGKKVSTLGTALNFSLQCKNQTQNAFLDRCPAHSMSVVIGSSTFVAARRDTAQRRFRTVFPPAHMSVNSRNRRLGESSGSTLGCALVAYPPPPDRF